MRASFLVGVLCFGALALAAWWFVLRQPPQPNIVIFVVDALRTDRLGTYGYTRYPTSPAIDRLAEHGVVFENAYAAAPWTLPSVASLFTSTFPAEHGVVAKSYRLPDSADTLAERLGRAGYTSYAFFNNIYLGKQHNLSQGFDFLFPGGNIGGARISAGLGPTPAEPFFVYAHTIEPHDPALFAPESTDGFPWVSQEARERIISLVDGYRSATEYDSRRGMALGTHDFGDTIGQNLDGLEAMRAQYDDLYDASVAAADSLVGSTIAMLQQRGWWENTLFVFMADHGEEIGDHGGWLHDQSCYEELLSVPLILRFPRDRWAGRRVDDVVTLVDLVPTLLDSFGRDDLAGWSRGNSLLHLIKGRNRARAQRPVATSVRINTTRSFRPWDQSRGNTNVAVRMGTWKGIWNADRETFELYDLAADPQEQHDVAADHPELVQTLTDYCSAWLARQQRDPGHADRIDEFDDETLTQLRRLGYVD